MIAMVQNLYAGNALRVFLEPPAGALRWKVLRKASNAFSGHDDPSALVAYEGDEKVWIDSNSLPNEIMAFYAPFYTSDGATWTPGGTGQGTPTATYEEVTTDVLQTIRERLEAGLLVEVQRGNLVNDIGYVQVFNASPSLERDLRFPLVTVHLEEEESRDRALGEDIGGDGFDAIDDTWSEYEGWLATVRITVIGWSLNSDERLELRKAIRRILIANLPVFAGLGWQEVSLSQQDIDAVNGEYPSEIYQVMSNFSCLAPVRVGGKVEPVRTVISTLKEI